MRTIKYYSIGTLLGLILLGCGPVDPPFNAKGRMTLDGKPFLTNDNGSMRIFFQPLAENATESFAAQYDTDTGTFTVIGKDLKGAPPGKYRVSVQFIKNGDDLLHNKLGGSKSPLICELVDAKSEVTIELDQVKDVVQEAKR